MYRAGILLENMEFFSVLKTADYFKIPSLGVFCVTNYCDKNAHEDFLKNKNMAQEKLERFVRDLKDSRESQKI